MLFPAHAAGQGVAGPRGRGLDELRRPQAHAKVGVLQKSLQTVQRAKIGRTGVLGCRSAPKPPDSELYPDAGLSKYPQ